MRMRIRRASVLVAGFVAGVAFVIACGSGGGGASTPRADGGSFFDAGRDAEAGVPDCDRWEVVDVPWTDMGVSGDVVGNDIKVGPGGGWEPFGGDGVGGRVLFRRCQP